MKITQMQSIIDKLETQLQQEKVENKANSVQIKKLQTTLINLGTKLANVKATKKFLEEKEKTIQVLKKKIKFTGAQHVQLSDLALLQQEKDTI